MLCFCGGLEFYLQIRDAGDPDLKEWQQLPGTFLPPPPADMDVTGWRDPFILERPSDSSPWWYVMVGAGIKQKLGTAMVYRSKHLKTGELCYAALSACTCWAPVQLLVSGTSTQRTCFVYTPQHRGWIRAVLDSVPAYQRLAMCRCFFALNFCVAAPHACSWSVYPAGWEYVGNLCESPSNTMWECPIMATLTSACPHAAIDAHNGTSDAQGLVRRHMLCISPDYCVNMAQYYLGDYAAGKFDLEKASGPHALDLGDILYAPNLLTDKHVSIRTLPIIIMLPCKRSS